MIIVGRQHVCGCCVNSLQLSAETSLDPLAADFAEKLAQSRAEVACLTALQRIPHCSIRSFTKFLHAPSTTPDPMG